VTARAARFEALVRRLGSAGDAHPAGDALLAAYAEPSRAYHGIDHLDDCLARLDEAAAPDALRDRVEAALWFHDAVYDPRADDNEARSAEMARAVLTGLGVAAGTAAEVARLVRLTDHRTSPADEAGQLLCDIDLSILGRSAEDFDAYDAAIRAEYRWAPEEAYRQGRREILRALIARDPLYGTEQFRRRYETAARRNLRRALRRLDGPMQ
jgi:predicted metal-dependent HD superfamily phosphohydrolase